MRDVLVDEITNIITSHQLLDYGAKCTLCNRDLYGQGNGSTLSRHRAEQIADFLIRKGLVPAALT